MNDIVLLQYSSAGSLLSTVQTGSAGADNGYGVSVSGDGFYAYVTGSAVGSLNSQPYNGVDAIE